MIVYTDDRRFAAQILTGGIVWRPVKREKHGISAETDHLIPHIYEDRPVFCAESASWEGWEQAFLVRKSSQSHYDLFIDLSRKKSPIPSRTFALAGEGPCHGQRGREWSTLPGNIHLTAFFSPENEMIKLNPGFSILTAVSVVEAIDRIPGFENKARIKWVNDILIEGAKVAGFLAYSQSTGMKVSSAVLGIGLNVEAPPKVKKDPFVPQAASLNEFALPDRGSPLSTVLKDLLDTLLINYHRLLSGKFSSLLDVYRRRSAVLGRRVAVVPEEGDKSDRPEVSGRVTAIGDNLELFISGISRPVTSGRLILLD